MRKGNSSIATMNLLARKIWSNFFYFYICYHVGGSTKHLPRPEVRINSLGKATLNLRH